MFLDVNINGVVVSHDLDALAEKHSGVITIGKKCKEVWNAIAIESESVDAFQCHLIGPVGGPWKLNEGQNRTECPKGLMSSKLVPCNGCMGRCVNLRAGRPKYYQRDPATATLVNGDNVGKYGTEIKEGDTISFGDVSIMVR